MGKTLAPNPFRKSKISRHLYHFWAMSLYLKIKGKFNICAWFGFNLFGALLSC